MYAGKELKGCKNNNQSIYLLCFYPFLIENKETFLNVSFVNERVVSVNTNVKTKKTMTTTILILSFLIVLLSIHCITSSFSYRKKIAALSNAEKKAVKGKLKLDTLLKTQDIRQWDFDVKTNELILYNINDVSCSYAYNETEFLETIHPDDRKAVCKFFVDMITGEKTHLAIQCREKNAFEEFRWLDIYTVALEYDKNGSAVKYTGMKRDIDDEKKKTEEMIFLRNEAEESNRLKSTFLANMSHEIRTPLNAIVGFSQLLPTAETEEEAEEFIRLITMNNQLLLKLIGDILDISKIEAGQMEFVTHNVNVVDLLEDIQRIYIPKMPEHVSLLTEIPDDLMFIETDKMRFTQVISNFLNNAIKYTVRGSITIGYTEENTLIRFFVRDTGVGISKENKEKVFQRFTKLNHFVQGSGLGLSISHAIVAHMNGEIGVDSDVGKGSEFWFTIPKNNALKNDNVIINLQEHNISQSKNVEMK